MANKYNVGIHNVGSYQVSGWPWITGSVMQASTAVDIEFPMVAKSVTVIASGSMDGALRVHFLPSGSDGRVIAGKHYITLNDAGSSITANVKCNKISISNTADGVSGFELLAELTNIPAGQMYTLTGSGVTD